MKSYIENIKKLVKTKMETSKTLFAKVTDFTLNKLNDAKDVLSEKVQGTVLEETRFDFHHFTTVCIVSLLAFFITLYTTGFNTTRVDAASMSATVM